MSTTDRIVRIAERRNNLVTTDDLERLGLSERTIRRLAASRHLIRIAPGVYVTSWLPDPVPQWELGLCLANPGVVLSHSSAATFWGIRRAPKGRFEVTVPIDSRLRNTAALIHRSNRMPDGHVVDTVDGARVTSVARTVFDLGGVLDEKRHLSVIEDVRNKQLCTDEELGEVYRELWTRGRRGSAAWCRLAELTERAGRPTMSELELEVQCALVEAGMPAAVQQHPLVLPNGRLAYLDLAYSECRLDIEVDHSTWHNTLSSIERDKARDIGLAKLGWERLRFTERMLERLAACVDDIRAVYDLRHRLTAA